MNQPLLTPGRPAADARAQPAPRLPRRGFLQTVAAHAGGLALAACAPRGAAEGPPSDDRVQLVYQDWRTDWFPPMAQEMLAQFHADHPNIRVFYTPDPSNLQERMQADFQSGTAPDVLSGCCDFFPAWAQAGYLLDLRPFVEADLDRQAVSDWDPAQYQALFTQDGLQFALPKYHGALGLFYNRDIFDEYRMEYPDGSWTHDDYLTAMRRLTGDRDGDGQIDLWGSMLDISWERIQVHVNGWGGHFVDPGDPTRSWMARPESLRAMRWIHDRMWDEHVMATPLDVQNVETRQAFLQSRLAMVEDGSWALKDILERAEFRVGVAPFPAGPVRKVTLATTDGFGIYAGTKYPEAAWELVKFLVSPQYGRAMAQAHFLQPARSSLVDEWARFIRQAYPQQTRQLDIEAFAEGHLQGYSVTAEIFARMESALELTKNAWQRIFILGEEPVDSMVQVSGQIELAQSRGG
jgi:multiple sugar transport system substrate-binding protein